MDDELLKQFCEIKDKNTSLEKNQELMRFEIDTLKETTKKLDEKVAKNDKDWNEQRLLNQSIDNKLTNINDGINRLNNYIEKQDKKAEEREQEIIARMEKLEESQKFNWVEWIKTKAIPFLIVGGISGYIVYTIANK